MGVVVLHGPRFEVELEGVLGGQVLGVQVVGDDFRLDPEQPAQVHRRLQEGLIGGEVLEVADVVAAHEDGLLGHRDRALELGAHGEHLAAGLAGQRQGLRHVAAGPAGPSAGDGPVARTTESSQRMWIGRSWASTPSTMGPSRAKASSSLWAIGSSDRLPLLMTSGRPPWP